MGQTKKWTGSNCDLNVQCCMEPAKGLLWLCMFDLDSEHWFTLSSISDKWIHSGPIQHISFSDWCYATERFYWQFCVRFFLFSVAFGLPLGYRDFIQCVFLSLKFLFNTNVPMIPSNTIAQFVGLLLLRILTSKLKVEKYTMTQWQIQVEMWENLQLILKLKICLTDFSATKFMTKEFHVDDYAKIMYDMILGRDLSILLGLNLTFS